MAPSYFQQNNRRRPLKGERDRTRKLPLPPRTRIELKEERKSLIGKNVTPPSARVDPWGRYYQLYFAVSYRTGFTVEKASCVSVDANIVYETISSNFTR